MKILNLNHIFSFTLTLLIFSLIITLTSCEKDKPVNDIQHNFAGEDISHKFDLDELTLKVSNDENFNTMQEFNYETAKTIETTNNIEDVKQMPADQLKNLSTQLVKNIPELNYLDENRLIEVFVNASNPNRVPKNCNPPRICCINALVATYNACIAEASARYLQGGNYNYNSYAIFTNGCVFSYNFGRGLCPS